MEAGAVDAESPKPASIGPRLLRIVVWVAGVAAVILLLNLAGVPTNLGTWVMLVMLATLIAGATFAAVFSGLVVEKIPFSILNVGLYLYLFRSVSGSFSIKLGFVSDHSALLAVIAVGAIALLAFLGRIFWKRLAKLRAQLATGGAVLRQPRTALVASVSASNSVSNSVSVTPGGVGVTQAMNTAALAKSTSADDATAYSVAQQLIVSAWDAIFAVVMVSWAFGWSGGRELVQSSYGEGR